MNSISNQTFVLLPFNMDYLNGESEYPLVRPAGLYVLFITAALLLMAAPLNLSVVSLMTRLPDDITITVVMLLIAIVIDLIALNVIRNMMSQRHMNLQGEVIQGRLTHISVAQHETAEDSLMVQVTYEFVSPHSGQEQTGRARAVRKSLDPESLPQVGAPVAIQYLNDKFHTML